VLTMNELSLRSLIDSYANPMTLPLYSTISKDVKQNLRQRRHILQMADESPQLQRELWVACKRDIFFWINLFVWTYNPKVIPRITTRPMVTYSFQDGHLWELLSAIVDQVDHQTEKSREMAATWDILLVFLWLAQFHGDPDGYSFRIISRNEKLVDSKEDPDSLFAKIDFILEHQPDWMISREQYSRRMMHLMFYETNSTIDGNATTRDAARGGRATAMALDEFAAVPDGHAMMRATGLTTNCRLYNSTPQGTGNAFYDIKKLKIRRTRLHWSQHPDKRRGLYRSENGKLVILDQSFRGVVRDSKGNGSIYPDNYVFRLDGKLRSPWYDKECDRAAHPMEIRQELDIDYLGSDYQFFDPEVIGQIQEDDIREPYIKGEIEFDYETLTPLKFVPKEDGRLHLWINQTPEGKCPPALKVICGSDVAAGTGASNSASSFVNKLTGEKIGEFADANMHAEDFAIYTIAMAKWFNHAQMIWDASGPHGIIFGNTVVEKKYENVFYNTAIDKISRTVSDKPGFWSNPKLRAIGFGKYRMALKQHTFVQRSYEANHECLFYIQGAGSATAIEHTASINTQDPTGARANHGDRCVADMVANFWLSILQENMVKKNKETEPKSGFGYRRKQYEEQLAAASRDDWD